MGRFRRLRDITNFDMRAGTTVRLPSIARLFIRMVSWVWWAAVATAAAAPTQTNTPVTGINAGSELVTIYDNEGVAGVNAYMAKIAAWQVHWIRLGINWDETQHVSASQEPKWTRADVSIKAARNNGMKVLGVIILTPPWAISSQCPKSYWAVNHGPFWQCAPDPDKYARYAAQTAAHYSSDLGAGRVDAWEIWNEPNCGDGFIPHDPALYTSMLKKSYAAIKKANPQALVFAGGSGDCKTAPMTADSNHNLTSSIESLPPTQWDSRDWLMAMYANGAKNSFDALAHHPYCFADDWMVNPPSSHTQDPAEICPAGLTHSWSAFTKMHRDFPSPSLAWPIPNTVPFQSYTGKSLRTIMHLNGDDSKTIAITEFGAPTTGDEDASLRKTYWFLTQANQYRELQAAWTWISQQPVTPYGPQYGPIFVFCYSDARVDPRVTPLPYEPYFGLVTHPTRKPKQVYKLWRGYGEAATYAAKHGPLEVPAVGPGW